MPVSRIGKYSLEHLWEMLLSAIWVACKTENFLVRSATTYGTLRLDIVQSIYSSHVLSAFFSPRLFFFFFGPALYIQGVIST